MMPLYVDAYTFTRTLNIGSEGVDVLELQKVLNSNPSTLISETGIGSIGNESTFFGEKTKQAVIKLQNLYAKEILYPNGLNFGTGIVGMSTISLLNSLQNPSSEAPITQVKPQNTVQTPILVPNQFFISEKVTKAGSNIYVGSQNKLSDLKFFMGSSELKKKCYTDFTCQLSINKNVKPGEYVLSTTSTLLGQTSLLILDSSIKNPEINIKKVSLSKENIIKGKNFGPKMTVYTLWGIFEVETKNNSFVLNLSNTSVNATTTMSGPFYVENENGLKSDILEIQYEK